MLALARTCEGSSGAKGLSFFIVESKHYKITGIEKKLGLKASATCEVALEDAPGELVGQEGYGLVRYVIGMLNGARMGIAAMRCLMIEGAAIGGVVAGMAPTGVWRSYLDQLRLPWARMMRSLKSVLRSKMWFQPGVPSKTANAKKHSRSKSSNQPRGWSIRS